MYNDKSTSLTLGGLLAAMILNILYYKGVDIPNISHDDLAYLLTELGALVVAAWGRIRAKERFRIPFTNIVPADRK